MSLTSPACQGYGYAYHQDRGRGIDFADAVALHERDHRHDHSVRGACFRRRPRCASIPPGYSSGRLSIFRDPHAEYLMRLPIAGTGTSGGSGMVDGSTSRSRKHCRQ